MYIREESRTTPRFEPKDPLSVYVADKMAFLVQGDVKNLSEVGACVTTNATLTSEGPVTVDIRSGYSFLFRAEAQIVWCSETRESRDAVECAHGIRFTDLSPFSRKLIRRLGGGAPRANASPPHQEAVPRWEKDADSDPDLEILFREESSLGDGDDDWFEMLTDPSFDDLLVKGSDAVGLNGGPSSQLLRESEAAAAKEGSGERTVGAQDRTAEHLARRGFGLVDLPDIWESSDQETSWHVDGIRASDHPTEVDVPEPTTTIGRANRRRLIHARTELNGSDELTGNLGYFSNTDVLQMLEAARATGILFLDGELSGEIHLKDGRICGCFSKSLSDEEAAFRLLVARTGRFHFIPTPVRSNIRKARTTTQLLLEAELRRDLQG